TAVSPVVLRELIAIRSGSVAGGNSRPGQRRRNRFAGTGRAQRRRRRLPDTAGIRASLAYFDGIARAAGLSRLAGKEICRQNLFLADSGRPVSGCAKPSEQHIVET